MQFLHRIGSLPIVDRERYLIEAARGRRVIHLGCVDAGLLDARIQANDLLHSKLARSSADLWGMDLDAAGIERLRSLGYRNLVVGTAEAPPETVPRGTFEVVIAGELIEHVRNVGQFLEASGELLCPGGLFIITTPNALRFYNPIPAIFGAELVHPDHLAWFSPKTLRRAVEMSGLSVQAMFVYRSRATAALGSARNPFEWLARLAYNGLISVTHPVLTRAFPLTADGLILVAESSKAPLEAGTLATAGTSV